MSVHLDAVLLPVAVVGFARIPVGVGDGGVVLPPAPEGGWVGGWGGFIFWPGRLLTSYFVHSIFYFISNHLQATADK